MTTALERLQGGYYNSAPVSGGNPGGLGDGGHVVNFPQAANDMGEVGALAAAAAASAGSSAETATAKAALATDKAEIATDKAEDAEVAAYEAGGFRNEAQTFRDAAEGFKTTAQGAATTATDKAAICTDKAALVEALTGPASAALAALYQLVEALDEDPDALATLLASMAAKADLVDGKLRVDQLPALAIGATTDVADEAAMLALTAEPGDIAIRTDESKTYRLAAEPATTLANWKWLRTPTDVVLSVAGLTGTITKAALRAALELAIGDVAGLQDALDAKAASADLPAQIAGAKPVEHIMVALSDETTVITAGVAKVTMRMPYAFTLTAVRASLNTASSSGNPTVDINEGGASILLSKLTIDATEKTSTTAATAAVISDPSLADDAEITFDIDVAGTGAKGLKVILIGRRT